MQTEINKLKTENAALQLRIKHLEDEIKRLSKIPPLDFTKCCIDVVEIPTPAGSVVIVTPNTKE